MNQIKNELKENNENYKVVDMRGRKEECKKTGHTWKISGFWKHNPHLWCSYCCIYLDQNRINELGYTEIFYNLLKNDNPEGFYL